MIAAIHEGSTLSSSAHPAHAKPVNYPYVVGFERFHSGLDDDDYLAQGGMILLNELNCVACHAPPQALSDQLSGAVGTNLAGVANRLEPVDLEIMIRNPRFVKKDTTMPSQFAGPDRDLEEVEALKHYLASLDDPIPEYPVGDIDTGRLLYHQIGCVACHAPEVGYRPIGIPDSVEIELAGLPSVPMNLADLYSIGGLTHFLLHPRKHRPSGRMPDFKLSEAEAVDLAAYLKAGPDMELPANLSEALSASDEFSVDPLLVGKGRDLFASKNCVACHEGAGEPIPSLPLAEVNALADWACLSERPESGGVPFYGLDVVQKRAIVAALQRLGSRKKLDRADQIDWNMKRLNCYACHEREGVGGPEYAREAYFAFADSDAIELGRWGNLPPPLDHVGAKLTDDWIERVMKGERGGGAVRDYMMARMPLYLEKDAAYFRKELPKADRLPDLTSSGGTADNGERLLGANGGNCLSCHPVGSLKSEGLPGINLGLAPQRLQKNFFHQIITNPEEMQPGTPMPDLIDDSEASQREIDSIYRYLETLK